MKRNYFPTSIIQSAKALTFPIDSSRKQVMGITIDGETSLDLDDAIWIEPRQDKALISVHIADPTAFILPYTALDKIVLERIETVYLKNGNDPMLPHILSENKISLLEGQPRPTISIHILVDSSGDIKETKLELSVLSNLKKFTYDEVDSTLNNPPSPYYIFLKYCDAWAQKLNYNRSATGAIGGTYQAGLHLNEDGAIEVITYKSQQIIQEFMVLANKAIASLAEQHKLPIVYRNQIASAIAPDQKKMMDTVLSLGVPELIRKKLQSWLNAAEYAPYVIGHFALALPSYTHFTSPIRRLADYINHRIIKAVLINQEESPYSLEELRGICDKINQYKKETRGAKAEYFTEQNERNLLKIASGKAEFNNLSNKEFSDIIKLATKKGNLENIQTELLERLENNRLKPVDYYYLTFFDYPEKDLIVEPLKKYLDNHHNLVSQFLTIAAQMKQVELRFIEEEIAQQNYIVWTVFEYKTTKTSSKDKSKLVAKHKASFLWIDAYLKSELVDVNQRELEEKEEEELIPVELIELPEIENPIGQLNEYLMKNKKPLPKYTFTAKGSEWECECVVQSQEGREIKQTHQATSKKDAKQVSALLVLQELGMLTVNS